MYSISLFAGVVSSALSHPFEFLKTKIQVYNEGIGIRQKGLEAGYNSYRLFVNLHNAGYGTSSLYTGYK